MSVGVVVVSRVIELYVTGRVRACAWRFVVQQVGGGG